MTRSYLGKTKSAFRRAFVLSLGGSLFATGYAGAQTLTPGEPGTASAPIERVVVTGSNIPSAAEVGPANLDVVDTAAIARTGSEDVLTALQKTDPSFSGGGNLGGSNASIAGATTYGGSAISLRGLPTLVLLNGRRITSSAAIAAGGAQFADVNLFPISLIKRVEVLKDGASAIYGSDAVGGVVNVILNNEFQGFQVEGRYGFAEKSDIHDQRYTAIAGIADDKGHIVVGAEYVEQDPVFDRQRDFAHPALTGTSTAAGLVRFGGKLFSLNPALTTGSGGGNPILTGGAPLPLTNASLPAGTYVSNPGASNGAAAGGYFDLAAATTITLDSNRTSAYGSVDRELFGKHVVAFADFLYTKNYSQYYLNGQPISTNAGSGGALIPATAPFNPFGVDIGPDNASTFQVNNRFVSSPRVFRQDTNFYRLVAGLRGEIVKDYNYEVAFNGSRDEINYTNKGLINGAALNQALAGGFDSAGNPVVGGAYSQVGPAAASNLQPAIDFFSQTQAPGALNGVSGTDFQNLLSSLWSVDGKIQAFPITLPAGPLGVAFGGEYRYEKIKAESGAPIYINAPLIGNVNKFQDVRAGFAEISIPVVGPDMKIPGVYSFDIDAAFRYEKYSTAGESVVPKVSFIYRPIQDIAIRGGYSQSFVAPNLAQLFVNPTTAGATAAVILSPATGPEQAGAFSFSNPNLTPAETETYTAGIVISPHQIEGLTISADYFHIEQTDVVGAIPSAVTAPSVNALGAASPYAALFHLGDQNGPAGVGLDGVTPIAPGELAGNLQNYTVVSGLVNTGGTRIQGVDFTANYTHSFGIFGTPTVGINGTYFTQYKASLGTGLPYFDILGFDSSETAFSNAGLIPDYRLAPYIEYTWGGLTVSALGNYIPSTRDAIGADPSTFDDKYNVPNNPYTVSGRGALPKIRDYYTIDLRLSYEFGVPKPMSADATPSPKDAKDAKDGKDSKSVTGKDTVAMMSGHWYDGLKLGFGVNNVTNARPPLIADSPDSTNTESAIYDPYQRYYYFTISKKF